MVALESTLRLPSATAKMADDLAGDLALMQLLDNFCQVAIHIDRLRDIKER